MTVFDHSTKSRADMVEQFLAALNIRRSDWHASQRPYSVHWLLSRLIIKYFYTSYICAYSSWQLVVYNQALLMGWKCWIKYLSKFKYFLSLNSHYLAVIPELILFISKEKSCFILFAWLVQAMRQVVIHSNSKINLYRVSYNSMCIV